MHTANGRHENADICQETYANGLIVSLLPNSVDVGVVFLIKDNQWVTHLLGPSIHKLLNGKVVLFVVPRVGNGHPQIIGDSVAKLVPLQIPG